MQGPQPRGFWTGHNAGGGRQHQFLKADHRYRVIKEFVDHDSSRHPIGEEWVFLGYSFLPYEDGMSFFVSLAGEQEWLIPLQWRDEQQGAILNALGEYVQAV